MNDIIINKINDPIVKYVIFSVSSDSPLFLLDDIYKHTCLKNGQMILFDQLLQTGDSENRFLCLTFLDGKFDLSTIQHIRKNKIDVSIYKFISEYLREKQLILHYSILLDEQKNFILNGGNL